MRNIPHPYLLSLLFGCALAAPAGAQTAAGDAPLRLSFAPSLNGYASPAPAEAPERPAAPAAWAVAVPTGAPQAAAPAGGEAGNANENGLQVREVAAPTALPRTIDLTESPNDLWERIRNGYAMPTLSNDQVEQNQTWYMNRPDYLRRMVERSRRYLHYIVEEIERRGLPTELAFLPMVESAYNPMAYSRSHAVGLWQFIPSTGKSYKLEQNWWVDKRRDIVASTGAALDYLQNLYEMQGDWHLALASYNWGEGAVQRAMAKNRAKGLPTDYESLTMPAETRNYVPKLQALKNIFSSPRLLAQLDIPPLPNTPYFATVPKPADIDVKVAAKLAEMPVQEFVALNPAHNRPVIKGEAHLVIPSDKVETFLSNLESHDKPLSSWGTHVLQRSEKLEKVAMQYGLSVVEIKTINGYAPKAKVPNGAVLLVPVRTGATLAALPEMTAPVPAVPAPASAPATMSAYAPAAVAAAPRSHKVGKGETLFSIAKRYDVPLAELKKLNGLKGDKVALGTTLTLSSKATPATPERAQEKPGKGAATVVAKAEGKAGKATQAKASAPKITRYTIRRGDTLASIAKHFKVDQGDLQRWNKVSAQSIKPGQTLTIQLARND